MSEEKGQLTASEILTNLARDRMQKEYTDEDAVEAVYNDVVSYSPTGYTDDVEEDVEERESDVEEFQVDNLTVKRLGSKDMIPVDPTAKSKEIIATLSDIFYAVDPDSFGLVDMDTFEQTMVANFIKKYHTMIKKQQGYGPENISKAGLRGIITRSQDKLERAKTLVGDPDTQIAKVKEILTQVDDAENANEILVLLQQIDKVVNPRSTLEDESLVDTLGDLGNYGDIAVLLAENAWGKTLEHK